MVFREVTLKRMEASVAWEWKAGKKERIALTQLVGVQRIALRDARSIAVCKTNQHNLNSDIA